jgi:hypothetical protein
MPHSRRVPFTHMGPADTRVWQAALALGLFPADSYEYDVKLAGAIALVIDGSATEAAMWQTLLKKRVDVVAWRGKVPWIVEVKPVASFAALGQCLGYGFLWEKEKPKLGKPRLSCVCARVDPDLRPCFESFGVSVVELPLETAERLLLRHPKH